MWVGGISVKVLSISENITSWEQTWWPSCNSVSTNFCRRLITAYRGAHIGAEEVQREALHTASREEPDVSRDIVGLDSLHEKVARQVEHS
jgi:hypothetical protein